MDAQCQVNRGIGPLVVGWVLLVIGIVTTGLRFQVKLQSARNLGWDDFTALAALAVAILGGGFFTKMIAAGMGRYQVCVEPEELIAFLEFSALSEPINVVGIGVTKISVCLCLLRIVEGTKRKTRWFLWSLLVIVAASHLALALIFFLHCLPLAALWNPEVSGTCMSTENTVLAGYIGFAFDIITDFVCAIIPVLVIRKLKMNARTKVALCALMGLGVFTAGAALAKALTLRGVLTGDATYDFTEPATWAVVEQFLGVVIISLPALRPLFSRVLHSTGSKVRGVAPKRSWRPGSSKKRSAHESKASQTSERTLVPSNEPSTLLSVDTDALDKTEKDLEAGFYRDYLKSWHLPDDEASRLSAVLRIPDSPYR